MTKSKLTISGRTAVISGAASGMGRSLAQRLSAHGSPVAITDVNEAGLKETEASLKGPVLSRVLDVRDAQAQTSFAQEVRDWTPAPVGAVFNNAGVVLASAILGGDPADDEWLWDIDFRGVVNGTRAFLPILVDQGDGAIVNTSSVFGLAAVPNQSAYCAAKSAVRAFTDSLRHELRGTGVRAINVFPGGVNTNIVRNARFAEGPDGLGLSREAMIEEFTATSLTQPDKAAEIIHRGVEAGKARILVGPDAHLFDLLTRITPTHYMDVMYRFQGIVDKARRAPSLIRQR
ncbi:acetoin dehydrogenase [Mycolicibacterium novocastrense]|uniref:SDR family NAD(P)-dependent oxidoreductase n=1 Tax=Mycolicibacterium novocastrense TaxID=59813 RepID=UPI000746AD0A|nr:SDR family NAD(P)-dependent oxidoreductase [Mycolicibacterium novocastrense]KUH75757.1 acetoin dehydrogenase [Mycolicibacterium novocastrense]KUH78318.1 acetoin dehydrogenase [Mycolicibacterium novocastrense]KUH79653.1 acetoin dehydrogenase [Mycolicibacterium novocastrense]